MGHANIIPAIAACLATATGAASAQDAPDLPLWELGVGGVVRGSPDYPGASEYSSGASVFPFVTYRGRIFEFGDEATARVVPFRSERFEIGVTFDGSSAVDSRDNALRGTLPDLDALAEFGPEFIYRFAERPAYFGAGTGRFEASLQTRGVFSIGSDIDHVGNLVRPALRYRQNGALKPGARISASIGPIFASEGVHDFFYSVPGAFDARGGYLGTEANVSIRYPVTDRARVIAGAGVTFLGGASNDESPLFDEEINVSAFFGVTYSLFQSTRRTSRDR